MPKRFILRWLQIMALGTAKPFYSSALFMLGTHDLYLFIISGLLLNITPGADSLYIATRSVSQGARAGVFAALGISVGCYVHIIAAALGVSAVLAASATAFTLLKFIGAAYLIYLGLSILFSKSASVQSVANVPVAPIKTIFWQGFLTNALNPKVALFFLAFVPQFIEPTAPHKALAFVFLGAIFNFTGTVWCLFLAWATARIGSLCVGSAVAKWLGRSVGALFVYLGVRLAFAQQG